KVDRDVPSVGLTKQLVSYSQGAYGLEF
ncbi:GNAT family N-acetyltransferase, partial [Rhizobium ruizarguesonis]